MIHLALAIQPLQRVLSYMTFAFVIGLSLTPFLTDFLYKNKIGKRLRQNGVDGKAAPIFAKLHKHKDGTPTMGGLLFWVTTAVITSIFALNRQQTWLPVFALVAAGLIGAADDIMNVFGMGPNGGGMRLKHRFPIYAAVAAVGAWWFYVKLGWDTIYNPVTLHAFGHVFLHQGNLTLGLWYVPLFLGLTIFSAFSVNQTDGLDGLAGGVCAIACFVFTMIALAEGSVQLAIFCATLLGSLLAFLWFNINPARFFMGDTGSMALGMTLPILAFLTNTVIVLPLILLIPFAEGISTIIQIASKRIWHRKVFLVAPIHHHFEALGWPESKVTMRFWLIASVGCSVALLIMLAN